MLGMRSAPSRFIGLVALIWLSIFFLTRLVLLVGHLDEAADHYGSILAVGTIYDLSFLCYALLPLVLYLLLSPQTVWRWHRRWLQLMPPSNRRPCTYPNGRIDIPSGQGRDGAVKYADHAIGQFLRAAHQKPWFDNTVFVSFFGRDLLQPSALPPRGLIGNYQHLGQFDGRDLAILSPRMALRRHDDPLGASRERPVSSDDPLISRVITYCQAASHGFREYLPSRPVQASATK
jgi:hypothetical protein